MFLWIVATRNTTEEKTVEKKLTPKYLTKAITERAVEEALSLAMGSMSSLMRRQQCHVVVLVPGMEDARETDYPDWPNYPIQPVCLYEKSWGNPEKWEHPYDSIAKCKALQLWTDRNDDRTAPTPHLLFPGDTPFWGGVKRRGIVVTCSGVQPWFDKMISGIVADILVAMAHDAYENDPERKSGADFLS